MSDRCAGYIVVLDQDLSGEEISAMADAIRHFRGVIGVEPVADNTAVIIGEIRARADLTERLWRVLQERP